MHTSNPRNLCQDLVVILTKTNLFQRTLSSIVLLPCKSTDICTSVLSPSSDLCPLVLTLLPCRTLRSLTIIRYRSGPSTCSISPLLHLHSLSHMFTSLPTSPPSASHFLLSPPTFQPLLAQYYLKRPTQISSLRFHASNQAAATQTGTQCQSPVVATSRASLHTPVWLTSTPPSSYSTTRKGFSHRPLTLVASPRRTARAIFGWVSLKSSFLR